ncbi:hypothetical protein ACHAWX_005649 [Stephanocyclus meneghinianus]
MCCRNDNFFQLLEYPFLINNDGRSCRLLANEDLFLLEDNTKRDMAAIWFQFIRYRSCLGVTHWQNALFIPNFYRHPNCTFVE